MPSSFVIPLFCKAAIYFKIMLIIAKTLLPPKTQLALYANWHTSIKPKIKIVPDGSNVCASFKDTVFLQCPKYDAI